MVPAAAPDERPHRQVRAVFDDTTIAVYQAYPPEIAEPAIAAGTFVPPFGMNRMTWIKPSFLWMAYRSGWAEKPGQTRVLRITMTRAGFEWALANSALSHFDAQVHVSEADWRTQVQNTPVRIQWDPERDLGLRPLEHVRSLQVGLSADAVRRYVAEWITAVEDATDELRRVGKLAATDPAAALELVPREAPYPLPADLARHIAATPTG